MEASRFCILIKFDVEYGLFLGTRKREHKLKMPLAGRGIEDGGGVETQNYWTGNSCQPESGSLPLTSSAALNSQR